MWILHQWLRSIFLLQAPLCPSREASDRQFRQWHIALNTNTAQERDQRSRAKEITCDKLVVVPVVLCICEWGHPPSRAPSVVYLMKCIVFESSLYVSSTLKVRASAGSSHVSSFKWCLLGNTKHFLWIWSKSMTKNLNSQYGKISLRLFIICVNIC